MSTKSIQEIIESEQFENTIIQWLQMFYDQTYLNQTIQIHKSNSKMLVGMLKEEIRHQQKDATLSQQLKKKEEKA